jgi:hypothetical protein
MSLTFHEKLGIERQFIVINSPHQIDVVKRKNNTILDRVTCITLESHLIMSQM